jgi:hypothetical protein
LGRPEAGVNDESDRGFAADMRSTAAAKKRKLQAGQQLTTSEPELSRGSTPALRITLCIICVKRVNMRRTTLNIHGSMAQFFDTG